MPGTAQVRSIWVGQRRNPLLFLVRIHLFDEKGADGEPLKESGAARRQIHEDHLLLLLLHLHLLQESQTAFIHTAGVRLRPLLHDAAARFLFDLHKVSRDWDRFFACASCTSCLGKGLEGLPVPLRVA